MNTAGVSMVCHVLLLETDAGLVLVDSGYGLLDCADPGKRLGLGRYLTKPVLNPDETAARQIDRLGFQREDVRHILTTHFDYDHIGGLADFPHAQVHVSAAETQGAVHAPSLREKVRFRPAQWAHGPNLIEYSTQGESWRGFASTRELDHIAQGIVMVFMPGHTRGHSAIAVDAGERWILHCGDAFYLHGKLEGRKAGPKLLGFGELSLAFDKKQLVANQERLAELWRRKEPDLMIINAHDPELLKQARSF